MAAGDEFSGLDVASLVGQLQLAISKHADAVAVDAPVLHEARALRDRLLKRAHDTKKEELKRYTL